MRLKNKLFWFFSVVVILAVGYWSYSAVSGYLQAQFATGAAESYIQVQNIPRKNIVDFSTASYAPKSSQWESALAVKVNGRYYVYTYGVSLPEKTTKCSVVDGNNSGVATAKLPYPVLPADRD